MSKPEAIGIINLLQANLKTSTSAHEAEAWANALRSFCIALGVQENLKMLSDS